MGEKDVSSDTPRGAHAPVGSLGTKPSLSTVGDETSTDGDFIHILMPVRIEEVLRIQLVGREKRDFGSERGVI